MAELRFQRRIQKAEIALLIEQARQIGKPNEDLPRRKSYGGWVKARVRRKAKRQQ